jgi:predicted Rossmann fold nucleotide-binding protein DprA/Smf involved in DNA uptake
LKSVAKQLAALSKKVEKLSVQVNKVAAAKKAAPKAKKAASKKARPAAAKKTSEDKGTTVLNSVYDVIKKSRKGISISQLKQKTDLNPRQLSNALYKLTKKGSIKSMSRGVYTKA